MLVNGRRLSGGGTLTDSVSVDVNSIPLAAIERVEVLKDGASAVYGSDAIAGVVNFIIRDDYEGATLGLYGGGTSDGGGIKRANGAIGFGNLQDDRYNVMFAAGFQKEDALFGRDRSFANTAINEPNFNDTTSGNSFPANIVIPDGEPALPGTSGPTLSPLAGNCAPSVTSPLRDPAVCRFDTASLVSLFPDAERASAFGAAHYALSDALQLYAEASYSRNKQRFVIQPAPLSDQFNLPAGHPLFNQAPYNRGVGLGGAPSPFAFTTIVLKPSSPYYPTATVQSVTGGDTPDILVRYRGVTCYQRVGNKTTPKASLRWQPVKELLMRASYGKGFRAPSLTELYTPTVTGVSAPGLDDPARCDTTQNSNDCGTQFNVLLGGTPTLKPESSTDYTLGLVFQPTDTASIGFDVFRVNLKNPIIFGIDPGALLANEARFPGFINRGAPTADCPGCPGPVQQIDQHNLNLGATHVRGVDVDWRWRIPTESVGNFTVGLVGTYFSRYETQTPDGSFLSIVGRVSPIVQGAGGVIPRWHHFMTVGWAAGAWEATVSQNFQSGYADIAGNVDPSSTEPTFRPRRVGMYQTFDGQVSFAGIEHLKIGVGVKNALDKDPPYTNAGGQNFFQSGYDPGYADPRGRFFYGTVSYSFK